MAYRWGSTNDHGYIVAITTDKAKAIRLADNEPEYRGGKYGAAVHEDDEETNDTDDRAECPPIIHYAPSQFGERSPDFNWRIHHIEAMAHDMMRAVREDSDGKDWAAEIIRNQTERGDKMTAIQKGREG